MPGSTVNRMIAALSDLKSANSGALTVEAFAASPDARNEAVFFLKPELTSTPGVNLKAVAGVVEEAFHRYRVQVVAASVLSGGYLEEHDIMAQHYGAINTISRDGAAALSAEVLARLKKDFAEQINRGHKVVGGHQLLASSRMSAKELSQYWDEKNKDSKKLAPGTYAAALTIAGSEYIVLNGFHPYQLEYFTAPQKMIAVAIVRSEQPWRVLRTDLIGSTDPTAAAEGSIRNSLLLNKQTLGIAEVSKGLNGVHLSAGPIEGLFEIMRFFAHTDTGSHANMMSQLKKAGLSEARIRSLSANPSCSVNGRTASVYDLTEELDMSDAVELVRKI